MTMKTIKKTILYTLILLISNLAIAKEIKKSNYKQVNLNMKSFVRQHSIAIHNKNGNYLGWKRELNYDYFPSVKFIRNAYKPTKCKASYYDYPFNGRKTANGEIFYSRKFLTAASPYLPLPSLVKVTNIKTGVSSIIKINDRGPFINFEFVKRDKNYHRCLDLSAKAFKELNNGSLKEGIIDIKIEYLALHTAVYQSLVGLSEIED